MTDRPIAWSCPHCGAELRAKREAEASQVHCPKCGEEIRVPDSDETPDFQGDLGAQGAEGR